MKDIVVYNNKKYSVQTSGRYYTSYSKNVKYRLLHRQVWFDNYGEIPKGKHIHHKDGNWRNNDISNLEMIDSKEHSSKHMIKRMQNPVYKANALKALKKAIIKAKDWHKSDEGIKWHKENGHLSWTKRTKKYFDCPECGNAFMAHSRMYCSNKCWQRQRKRMI